MDLFDDSKVQWTRYLGDERFDYPIDYSGAVLSCREGGHIDLLYRWAPNSYCHFHRHVAEPTSTVLSGELHVIDFVRGEAGTKRVRKAGDYAYKEPGDIHMEHGGPNGALVLFNLYAPDGHLAELLGPNLEVMRSTRIVDLVPV